MRLKVYVEINGRQQLAGAITGTSSADAVFCYDSAYLEKGGQAISQNLRVSSKKAEPFSVQQTRCFFEGLLPEGFSRKSVAGWMHADEQDYLTILAGLGKECLGALRIEDEDHENSEIADSSYRKLSIDEVKALAAEGATKSTQLLIASHLSLTGASGKAGLYLDERNGTWYQPYGMAPSTHIVKQSHIRLSNIVENERLALETAARMGIRTADSFIVNTGDYGEADILLATKRYDRKLGQSVHKIGDLPCPLRLHQEDFAQALGVSSEEKYEKAGGKYLQKMFRLVRNVSPNPLQDQLALLDILIFDVLIGNTDNHVKNVSLLYSPDLRTAELAPAYDILSTVIYPQSTMEMSVYIAGEKDWKKIDRETFVRAAHEIGMSPSIIRREYDRLRETFLQALESAVQTLEKEGFQSVKDIQKKLLNILVAYGKI